MALTLISNKPIPTLEKEEREEKEEVEEEQEAAEGEARKKKFRNGLGGEEIIKAPRTALASSASSSASSPASSCWRRVPSAFSVAPCGATPLPARPIAKPSGAVFNSVLRLTILFPQILRSFHRDELDLGDCRS